MKNRIRLFGLAAIILSLSMPMEAADKLSGKPIGSTSVDYSTGEESTTVNTVANAFDGKLDTYFASYVRSYTWVGLDLGEKHVITRVGWSPRDDWQGEGRVKLAMFEGANSPDFIDAVPLYLTTEKGKIGQMSYADVDCSRGFRYVRYVGPNDARCNVAEVEFYGEKGEGDDSKLHQITNLPTVIINTVNAEEPYDKEHDIVSNIIIISENGTNVLEAPGESRLRGNNSMTHPKKPYRIKFDKKQQPLDAPAKAKKWTLINNYGDKTLMRNMIAFEVARQVGMEYVSYIRPVDVILNGEYKGCYQLCDQIEVGDGRVPVTEMEETDISGDELTGGYLIEVDAYASGEISWFQSSRGIPVTIKSPDDDKITAEQKSYIKSYFNKLENAAYSVKYDSPTTGYRTMLDITSFLQHFIVGEVSGNTDTYWSTYMYKKRNDPKFYVGPVWDFDLAFENDNRTYPINNKTCYIYQWVNSSSAGTMDVLVERIVVNDTRTAGDLLEMWSTTRSNGLSGESLCDFVDKWAAEMDASQRLNFMRWDILNTKVHENPQASGSYEGEVAWVKNYLRERIAWMDNKIGYDPSSVGNIGIETEELSLSEVAEWRVYNVGGQEVYSVDGELSTTSLLPGIYIVKGVAADNRSVTTKIVVK
ncbi:MAG: CotH kinase family protein [Muribaculaceae bacterium]|nr:CotH kinase family protein [Muribaculaceae bacterium]